MTRIIPATFLAPLLMTSAIALSGCVTTPEPEPVVVEKPVEIVPPPIPNCTPRDILTRRVIPAEYQKGFHITGFENPPEYRTNPETGEVEEITVPPTERKVPFTKLIKPEEVIFVNDEGRIVEDVCNPDGTDPDEVGVREEVVPEITPDTSVVTPG